MSDRHELDTDEMRDALDSKRNKGCKCGYPDMPGFCPGPANCPMCEEEPK